jgi:hypothetical protein
MVITIKKFFKGVLFETLYFNLVDPFKELYSENDRVKNKELNAIRS